VRIVNRTTVDRLYCYTWLERRAIWICEVRVVGGHPRRQLDVWNAYCSRSVRSKPQSFWRRSVDAPDSTSLADDSSPLSRSQSLLPL
jgi:hypothetical protein